MGLFTRYQTAVVKNDFQKKNWPSYHIWKEHPIFSYSKNTIISLVNKIKETSSGERKKAVEKQ